MANSYLWSVDVKNIVKDKFIEETRALWQSAQCGSSIDYRDTMSVVGFMLNMADKICMEIDNAAEAEKPAST